jgi:hypothetical protein
MKKVLFFMILLGVALNSISLNVVWGGKQLKGVDADGYDGYLVETAEYENLPSERHENNYNI